MIKHARKSLIKYVGENKKNAKMHLLQLNINHYIIACMLFKIFKNQYSKNTENRIDTGWFVQLKHILSLEYSNSATFFPREDNLFSHL